MKPSRRKKIISGIALPSLPSLEPLERRALLAAAPLALAAPTVLVADATVTETESNDRKGQANGVELVANGTIQLQGTSESKRDKDYFKFTADADGPLTIAAGGTGALLAKIEVKDNRGREVFESEPNDGVNSGTIQLVAGRTYFLRARAPRNTAADYTIDLAQGTASGGGGTTTPGTVTEDRNNDHKGNAQDVDTPSGETITITGVSSGKNDRDFFTFVPSASGDLAVSVAFDGAPVQVEIEDGRGRDVFETEPNDGVNSGTAAVVAGETYFIRVRAKENGGSAYTVSLNLGGTITPGGGGGGGDDGGGDDNGGGGGGNDDGGGDDNGGGGGGGGGDDNGGGGGGGELGGALSEVEPNGTEAQALAFNFSDEGPIILTGVAAGSGDDDFFKFVPGTSGQVTLTVLAPDNAFAKLNLEDSASTEIFETEPNDGVNSGSVAVNAGETYYIRLRAVGDDDTSYGVAVDLV